ncbi:hypothetical protein M378DRAFT_159871 [Amanita muscaria Koide BX008]|uniref:Uncharacterized protein n=1 Tax=Amanita muscaria (strain Koide BX008) TaxID=946122 RepID=A0A0C2XDL5_AMAMK|nr:hypothetical protein M378DRAFT_159871 [Amanita muscaria Koide BX008]
MSGWHGITLRCQRFWYPAMLLTYLHDRYPGVYIPPQEDNTWITVIGSGHVGQKSPCVKRTHVSDQSFTKNTQVPLPVLPAKLRLYLYLFLDVVNQVST